jgi:very-short-patch-repair endonuclease
LKNFLPAPEVLALALKDLKIPFEREFVFHPTRGWRFDVAFPKKFLAVEVEGGARSGGRHTRGQGFIDDIEKYNAALELGWRVLRYPTEQVVTLECLPQIRRVLECL